MSIRIFVFFIYIFLADSAYSQTKKAKDIERITQEWAAANNEHNTEKLERLYAPTVLFYGKSKDVSSCINDKASFFDANDYAITISNIDIDFYKNGTIKCNFNKKESWKDIVRNDQAYLLFEQRGKDYLITGESDNRMDSKLGVDLQLGDKIYKKSNSFGIVAGIVISLVIAIGIIIYVSRKSKNNGNPFSHAQSVITENSARNNIEPATIQPETQLSNNKWTEEFQKPIESIVTPVAKMESNNNESISLSEHEKGYNFEKWVVTKFKKEYFEIIEWRSDKIHEGRYAKSNMLPDLEITFKNKNRYTYFAVECKWRKEFIDKKIVWAKDYQLKKYKDYEHTSGKPVFVVIGVGGSPDKPKEIYVLPLRIIDSTELSQYQLKEFYKKSEYDFFYDPFNKTLS